MKNKASYFFLFSFFLSFQSMPHPSFHAISMKVLPHLDPYSFLRMTNTCKKLREKREFFPKRVFPIYKECQNHSVDGRIQILKDYVCGLFITSCGNEEIKGSFSLDNSSFGGVLYGVFLEIEGMNKRMSAARKFQGDLGYVFSDLRMMEEKFSTGEKYSINRFCLTKDGLFTIDEADTFSIHIEGRFFGSLYCVFYFLQDKNKNPVPWPWETTTDDLKKRLEYVKSGGWFGQYGDSLHITSDVPEWLKTYKREDPYDNPDDE
jgi:hypothetical protein